MMKSERLAQISQQVSSGIGEAKTGADEIVQAMNLMVNLSSELTQIVGQLRAEFDEFKV